MTSSRKGRLSAPERLNVAHDFSEFDSGVPELDDWLRRRALANEAAGASRTYVVCADGRVVGYYSLATGGVEHHVATSRVRRNMPRTVPVVIVARLAIDQHYQNRGIGRGLLKDAILRTLQAAEIAGIRAMLVHAISESAQRFYLSCGFSASAIEPMTLMITVADARKVIED